jgi:hypothetical protein
MKPYLYTSLRAGPMIGIRTDSAGACKKCDSAEDKDIMPFRRCGKTPICAMPEVPAPVETDRCRGFAILLVISQFGLRPARDITVQLASKFTAANFAGIVAHQPHKKLSIPPCFRPLLIAISQASASCLLSHNLFPFSRVPLSRRPKAARSGKICIWNSRMIATGV